MSENRRKLAEELYEHRNDPGEWGEEAEEIEVKPRRSSVLSFRLPPEEIDALEQDMARTGETLSEYIRNALALRLHRGNFAESMAGMISGSVGIPTSGGIGIFTEGSGQRTVGGKCLAGGYAKATSRKQRIGTLS
ncbi:MAG: ribbon-helix-helix protein, CopG family [Rubrobacter sp.]